MFAFKPYGNFKASASKYNNWSWKAPRTKDHKSFIRLYPVSKASTVIFSTLTLNSIAQSLYTQV